MSKKIGREEINVFKIANKAKNLNENRDLENIILIIFSKKTAILE